MLKKSHRLLSVLKELAGLLEGAQLLVTLPLQVPLQDLLDQVKVCSLGSQKRTAGVRHSKHCKHLNIGKAGS